MSEVIITACDFCNKEQDIRKINGRGYVYACAEDAVRYFGWELDNAGNIKCLTCQEEDELKGEGK